MAARRAALTRNSTLRARFRRVLVREKMQEGVAGFLSIDDMPDFAAGLNFARVADLPAHFRVQGRMVQRDSELVFDLTTSRTVAAAVQAVESDEIGRMGRIEVGGGDDFFFLGGAGAGALFVHELFKTGGVHVKPAFASHQFGQVEGKTVGVVELESEIAAIIGCAFRPSVASGGCFQIEHLQCHGPAFC